MPDALEDGLRMLRSISKQKLVEEEPGAISSRDCDGFSA